MSHAGIIASILIAPAAGCPPQGARADQDDGDDDAAESKTADSIYARASDEGLGARDRHRLGDGRGGALCKTLGTLYTQRIWAEPGGEVEAVDSTKN